jgi:hypothetical protein
MVCNSLDYGVFMLFVHHVAIFFNIKIILLLIYIYIYREREREREREQAQCSFDET